MVAKIKTNWYILKGRAGLLFEASSDRDRRARILFKLHCCSYVCFVLFVCLSICLFTKETVLVI